MLHSTLADAHGSTPPASHPRAIGKGARVVDEAHRDGLPAGQGRRTATRDTPVQLVESGRAKRLDLCRLC